MPNPQPERQELLPVTEARSIDVRAERKAFETWWRMWCPDRDVPASSTHIFDAWLASARHRLNSLSPVERDGFAPCPICRQYSHTIDGTKLSAALMHFEAMFSHRGDGIPTQHCFDERTRDAAQVLVAAAKAVSPVEDAEGRAQERALIVSWLREQSGKGANMALARDRGTTSRASYGGGSFALSLAADGVERGDHIIGDLASKIASGNTESQLAEARSPVEDADLGQRASELLAAEFERSGKPDEAAMVRRGHAPGYCTPVNMDEALRAIVAALTPSGEREKVIEETISAWAFAHDIDGSARNDLLKRIRALNDRG